MGPVASCVGGHSGPGVEPVSLALQDGFLTTGPLGKPQMSLVLISFMYFVPNVARSSEKLI